MIDVQYSKNYKIRTLTVGAEGERAYCYLDTFKAILLNTIKKNGPTPASFSFIFVFSNTLKFLQKHMHVKMSIQYMVPGFELTTFGT